MADLFDDFSDIFNKKPGEIKPGLERMVSACARLDLPYKNSSSILIGGTNGKGTTSSFLWYFLYKSGLKTGLFTSPHLIKFRERYLSSDQKITDSYLREHLKYLSSSLGDSFYSDLSFFEVATLLALNIFKKQNLEHNVLEVGLGGRWDCTNIGTPEISAIVSIGLDHCEYLGDTLEQIMIEKLGIIRAGKPLFLGTGGSLSRNSNLISSLIEITKSKGVPLFRQNTHFGIKEGNLYINLPEFPYIQVKIPEIIRHQPEFLQNNFVLALAIFIYYRTNTLNLPRESMEGFLTNLSSKEVYSLPAFWGRFQKLEIQTKFGKKLVYFDVCHNLDGVKTFLDSIQRIAPNKKMPGIVSILKDKNIEDMVAELKKTLSPLVFFKIPHERTLELDQIKNSVEPKELFDSFDPAWNSMIELFGSNKEPIVICGSVLAIGHVLQLLSDHCLEIKNLYNFDDFIHLPIS